MTTVLIFHLTQEGTDPSCHRRRMAALDLWLSASLDLRKELFLLSFSQHAPCASQVGRDGLSPLTPPQKTDTIERKQAEGLAAFSCFNSELSAAGTTLSEQDKETK